MKNGYNLPTLYSLSRLESQFVVLLPVCGVDLPEVEGVGEEVVDEGAEGHAAGPAGGEVVDLDTLER